MKCISNFRGVAFFPFFASRNKKHETNSVSSKRECLMQIDQQTNIARVAAS
jgi:hypothetical protein